MSNRAGTSSPAHVVVVGGGFAAVEAVLALRALAGDRVRLTLISPEPVLAYRPAATCEGFDEVPPLSYDLRAVADDLELSYHRARLEAVAPAQKWVRLGSGARLDYDTLVLAIGARARVGVAGALTFRDQRDVPRFRRVLDDLDGGLLGRLVFAVPSGCSWPLPVYELALMSATRVRDGGLGTEIALVSPERRPLESFGRRGSRIIAELLAERSVRFQGGATATKVLRDSSLVLHSGPSISADRVVAAPRLHGQRITGVPTSWSDFVPTDAFGRVQGLAHVYAAGDVTTFPVKHGGLAAQQADRVAQVIAEDHGITVRAVSPGYVLRARLLGGPQPLLLRAELDQFGHARTAMVERGDTRNVLETNKVFGRYLTPYLEQLASTRLVHGF